MLTVPSVILEAAGRREDPVQTARSLVQEGQINEAILLLQDTIRRSPNRIEEAERLLSQIRRVRDQYNDLLERLITHLSENPGDIVTTLEIIDEMEAIDQYPNAFIAQQVGLARVIAQLAFDRSVADGLMAQAAEELAADRYVDAVNTYLSGFPLQRAAFERRDYPALVVNSVDRAVEQVRSQAAEFRRRAPEMSDTYEVLLDAVETITFAGIESSVDRFTSLHGVGHGIESETRAAGEIIAGHRETAAVLIPDDPVDWHLVLLERFIFGDPQTDIHNGILGAMQLIRLRQQERLSSAFENAREDLGRTARADFDARRWQAARDRYLDAQEISRFAVLMAGAGSAERLTVEDLERAIELLPETGLSVFLLHHAAYLSARGLAGVTVGLEQLDSSLETEAETIAEWSLRREQLAEAEAAVQQVVAAWSDGVQRYPREAAVFLPRTAATVAETEQQLETGQSEVREAEIVTVRRVGALRYEDAAEQYRRNRDSYEDALARIEGVEAEDAESADEAVLVVYRFPREALAELTAVGVQLEQVQRQAAALLDDLEGERDYVQRDEQVFQTIVETRELLARLEGLQQSVAQASEDAERRIATAGELRARGDQLSRQTEQALATLDVNRARDLWEQARDSYFESLEVQQDPEFRRQADQRIVALGVRLQEAENELIVQRVRELIDQATAAFRREEYRAARSVLTEAREIWARTNVEPNPELERLDRFVTAALTMENRRTLAATEPLYPVLSNYLNLAQNDYDRAQDIIRSNGLNAARPLLTRAEQNLLNVTAVRPYNWEARLLRLEILRIVESENFAVLFENRVNDAWQRRNEDAAEALVDLQALQAINPGYPNLTSRIEQLEIQLGIRPDPITQAQIARSNQLYQQAQSLASGGGAAQVRAAISVLEEAVTLNPDNSQAKVLLDTLRIGTGGQAAVALSSADEQQFRRAETLFIEGNVAQAFAIAERLLQNETNRLYPPLLNLRQRIANRLGI